MKLVKGLENSSYKEQLREVFRSLGWRRVSLVRTSLLPPALKEVEVRWGLVSSTMSQVTDKKKWPQVAPKKVQFRYYFFF